MTLTQTAFAVMLTIGFLGLIAATAAMVTCPSESFSITYGVRIYGCP